MTEPSEPRVMLPLFVDLAGRPVLVVGGGAVAARKALELAEARARVRVVAPRVTPELEELATDGGGPGGAPRVALDRRPFEDADVEGAWLVVAATDDAAAQGRIAAACERARVFCVAVDDPRNATAYGGGVVRRGPVTIAISTAGEAPALARLLREVIEQLLPDEGYVEAARALREKWKSEGTPMASRFSELVRAFKSRAS